MAISGISSVPTYMTFRAVNESSARQGQQATAQGMQESRAPMTVSNFGTQTKLGSSVFQQSNERIDNQGQQATHARMEEVAALYRKTASYGNPVLGGTMNISA